MDGHLLFFFSTVSVNKDEYIFETHFIRSTQKSRPGKRSKAEGFNEVNESLTAAVKLLISWNTKIFL